MTVSVLFIFYVLFFFNYLLCIKTILSFISHSRYINFHIAFTFICKYIYSPPPFSSLYTIYVQVKTCEMEYNEGGVGLECLTIQSELFGMRAKLSNMKLQEDLLDFIGNLGAGFGF